MVNHNHRLAEYEELKLSDLSGEHVAILSSGWGKYADQLKSYIEENFEDINLEIRPYFGAETYNECANGNLVLLGGFDSASVHPFIKAIPFVKDKEIGDNYIGFVYVNPPSAPIEKFVNAVSEIVKDTPEIVKEF